MSKYFTVLSLIIVTLFSCNKEPEPNPEDSLPEVFVPCGLTDNIVGIGEYPFGIDSTYEYQINSRGEENGYYVIKGQNIHQYAGDLKFYFTENPEVGKYQIIDTYPSTSSNSGNVVFAEYWAGSYIFDSHHNDTVYINKDIDGNISLSFCYLTVKPTWNDPNIPDMEFTGNISE